MRAPLDALEVLPLYDAEIWAYLDHAAHAVVNTCED
jgi:hemoglobin